MRPAYVSRCATCYERLVIPDEWQIEKTKDKNGKVHTKVWFDPDQMISKMHSC